MFASLLDDKISQNILYIVSIDTVRGAVLHCKKRLRCLMN